jgi:hypothetical protein
MALAESNRVDLKISEETTFAETPASPNMLELRYTSESLGHKKETTESEEIRDDRQVQDLIEIGVGADGDIDGELTFATYDKLLEGALCSDFGAGSGVTVGGRQNITLQAVAATQKIVRNTGSFVVDGFAVNQWVRLRGFSNAENNGVFKVSAVAALELTLTSGTDTLVDEAAATSRVVQGILGQAVAGVNLEVTAAAPLATVTRASGSFLTDGFVVGQWVRLIGFTESDNNDIWEVTAVDALTLTLSDADGVMATEAAAAGKAVFGGYLRDGTTKKSYLVEKLFEDIAAYITYRGMRVAKASGGVTAKQKSMLKFSLMGQKGVSSGSSVAGGTSSANENPVFVAGANVGTIKEGGAAIAQAVRELSWEIDNGLQEVAVVDSSAPSDITLGSSVVKGKVSIYLADRTHYNKFQDHTPSSLSYRQADRDGNVLIYTFPRTLYSNARPVATGRNGQVMLDADFQAVHDPTLGCQIQIDRIPV